jgi:hypothetical protein
MNFASISIFLRFSGNKISAETFCTQGLLTQGHWLEGPEAHSQAGHVGLAGQVGWASASPTCSQTPAMAGRGGSSGARERRGKGPGGPEPYPEVAGGVSSAGGGRTTAYLAAAARSFPARNGDGGGDSRRFRPIPWARRTREARRC